MYCHGKNWTGAKIGPVRKLDRCDNWTGYVARLDPRMPNCMKMASKFNNCATSEEAALPDAARYPEGC